MQQAGARAFHFEIWKETLILTSIEAQVGGRHISQAKR